MKWYWECLWEQFRTWGSLWELDENAMGTSWEQTKKQKDPLLPVLLPTPQKKLKGKH
jgi:hypothetical protein